MLTGPDDSNRWDRLCAVIASLVALHCVVAPLLTRAAAPLAGSGAHLVLALLSVGLSVPAVVRGWMEHHEARVFGWAVPAWVLFGVARLWGDAAGGEILEIVLTVTASVLLVIAHQLNRSLAYWHRRS